MSTRDRRSRCFAFTWNNPPADVPPHALEIFNEAVFVRAAMEVAPTTGTPHIQGVMQFECQRRSGAIRKALPGVHVEPVKKFAHLLQNKDYCMKDGPLWFTKGAYVAQGHRTDLDIARDALSRSSRMSDAVEECASYSGIRACELYFKYKEHPRSWKTRVEWFLDERRAIRFLDGDYFTFGGSWDGYDGHANVLMYMPDIASRPAMYAMLFGSVPARVDIKGGSRQFLARKIAVYHCQLPDTFVSTYDVKGLVVSINNAAAVVVSKIDRVHG